MGKHKVDKEKKSKDKTHSKKSKKEKKSKDAKHSKHSKHSKKSAHHKSKDKDHDNDTSLTSLTSSRHITIDDYFLKNEHFRVWCVLIKKVSFESLTSNESHELFQTEFLKFYNSNSLPEMFYKDEIPVEMREAALKTKHKWNFKVSNADKEAISLVADDVDFKTRHVTQGAWNHMHKPIPPSEPTGNDINHTISSSSSNINSKKQHLTEKADDHRRSSHDDERLRQDEARDEYKRKQSQTKKEYHSYSNNVLEEFSTYSGAAKNNKLEQIEKQKAMVQSSHAAAKEREEDRDGLNMDENFIMGGGDDFESTKARLNRNKDHRQQIKSERAKELLEKEEIKNAHFMAQLGVDLSKGPIRIQPREH